MSLTSIAQLRCFTIRSSMPFFSSSLYMYSEVVKCSSSMTMFPPLRARSNPITTMFSPSEVFAVNAISDGDALISCP